MRIVAGEFGGRRLAAPAGTDTRPTTDRVRESLFSALSSQLGSDLGGGAVLDAFAGSGALGLEAISRGAVRATLVERERRALKALRDNVAALGAQARARVVEGDALSLGRRGALPGGPFALILLDPPYRLDAAEVTAFVSALSRHDLLEEGAVVVYEHSSDIEPAWPDGFALTDRRRYGTTVIDVAIAERGAGPK